MEIVALKQQVNDDNNKLINEFVGIKPIRYMNFEFIEEITLLKRVHESCYLWAHKIDEYYAITHSEDYMLFHEQTLIRYLNCRRCQKNKRKIDSYCVACYRIENTHLDGCYCAGHFIEGGCIYCSGVGAGESPSSVTDSEYEEYLNEQRVENFDRNILSD